MVAEMAVVGIIENLGERMAGSLKMREREDFINRVRNCDERIGASGFPLYMNSRVCWGSDTQATHSD